MQIQEGHDTRLRPEQAQISINSWPVCGQIGREPGRDLEVCVYVCVCMCVVLWKSYREIIYRHKTHNHLAKKTQRYEFELIDPLELLILLCERPLLTEPHRITVLGQQTGHHTLASLKLTLTRTISVHYLILAQ